MTTLTLHLTDDQADAIRAALAAKTAQDAPMSTAVTNTCAPDRTGPPQPTRTAPSPSPPPTSTTWVSTGGATPSRSRIAS